MRHLGLFEGIGGFAYAARCIGWKTVAWCELNKFCQQVLRKNFPEAIGYGDITETDFTILRNRIWIITGGDPCQPSSRAGKQLGFDDSRFLWPEMYRSIREVQPPWVVNENVRDTISNGMLDRKISDLESEGYTCWPAILTPSCAGSALHERYRVWLVAYSHANADRYHAGEIQGEAGAGEAEQPRQDWQRLRAIPRSILTDDNWCEVASRLCRNVNEVPNRVDRNQAIGNAIDPYIAFQVFQAIEQITTAHPAETKQP